MIQLLMPFQLFTEDQCKNLIQRALATKLTVGKTYNRNPQVRTNWVTWIELDESEYDLLWELVQPWWHELDWFQKPVQISCYKPEEYYDWHEDFLESPRSSYRQLTLTCTLQTAPGAIFETREHKFDLQPGYAVIFPAKLDHRACAPTVGERWSFTVWYMKRKLN